jgi:hypothetical protein
MPTTGFLTGSRSARPHRAQTAAGHFQAEGVVAEDLIDLAMTSLTRSSEQIGQEVELMRSWNLDFGNRVEISGRDSSENSKLAERLREAG